MTAEEYINAYASTLEYKESTGVIVLKSGIPILVDNFFNYFVDSWTIFNMPDRKDEIKSPVITNGTVTVDIRDVSYMLKEPLVDIEEAEY